MQNFNIKEENNVSNFYIEKYTCDLTSWQKAPYQLISWWDMIQFSAKNFFRMATLLERLRYQSQEATKRAPGYFSFDKNQKRILTELLQSIQKECLSLSLPNSFESINEFVDTLLVAKPDGITNIRATQMEDRFDEIRRTIHREMNLHLFMYIPAERAIYCESYRKKKGGGLANPSVYLFGDFVNAKFPSASFDIIEAGNCFATARYTACVFHLMRVLEIGLSTLAKVFNVPSDHTNWQVIIQEIEKKIREMGKNPNKAVNWKDDQEFYAQTASHFMFLKDAWRNYTAHVRGKFGDEEAESILINVRAFMQKLATKISEDV